MAAAARQRGLLPGSAGPASEARPLAVVGGGVRPLHSCKNAVAAVQAAGFTPATEAGCTRATSDQHFTALHESARTRIKLDTIIHDVFFDQPDGGRRLDPAQAPVTARLAAVRELADAARVEAGLPMSGPRRSQNRSA